MRRGRGIMAAAALIAALTSCSNSGAMAGQQTVPEVVGASATPFDDPKPSPEAGEPEGPIGGPAYEAKKPGFVMVDRGEDGKQKRIAVSAASFTAEAKYDDGVTVSTSGFSKGVVTEEGAGAMTGAQYVLFTVRVRNGSEETLDLSAVVPTMVYGPDQVPAAPLYAGVPAADLVGKVAAGASAEGTYAFLVPADATKTVLYLDLNGTHAPVSFTGDLP
jgi:hypothetical protein